MNKENKKDHWVQTDPDSNQWGRQISITRYEFMEGNISDDIDDPETVREIIDLEDYTIEEIEECINRYEYSLLPWKRRFIEEMYPPNFIPWVIAECLFESREFI